VPEFAEEEARGDKEKMRRIAKAASERTLTYATVVAVLLFFFSEELGYLIYNSFEAGKFIAFLAPVLPIMYLDHVVDGALKGIGEQVYSMWVNIADAALSVILVYFLIPIMGIAGYAVVIIGMEAFNFCLSFSRLRNRVSFSISLFHSLVLPFSASSLSAFITDILFISEGSGTTVLLIVIKLIFTLGATLGILALYNLLTAKKAQKPCKKSNGKISLN
jgi:stage V sporulation protein B